MAPLLHRAAIMKRVLLATQVPAYPFQALVEASLLVGWRLTALFSTNTATGISERDEGKIVTTVRVMLP